MHYEGRIFRPPSEAKSYILQASVGCSHNKCAFCSMYKEKSFHVRPLDEIIEELKEIRQKYKTIKRWFIADGDSLAMKDGDLVTICQHIREWFPETERISCYGTPYSVLNKDIDTLRHLGIDLVYMGVESGADDVLRKMHKGVTSSEMIEAGQRLKAAGIKQSLTLIAGLGGKALSGIHAKESARVISAIDPEYVGFLSLMVEPGTPLARWINDGEMETLSPKEVIAEIGVFLENVKVSHCVFRANHASNYRSLGGVLPDDLERLIEETKIDGYIRSEAHRML